MAAFIGGLCPALAQTAEDLSRLEKQLQERKAAAANLEKKEQSTAGEVESLRSRLITATEALQDKQEQQEDLEDKLDSMEKESALRASSLENARSRLATLTSALLQLSREPPPLFALRESSAVEHVHRAVLLRSLIPKLQQETTDLAGELEKFDALQKQTSEQRRIVMAAQQNLQWQKHSLDQLVKTRQGLLEKTQAEKETLNKQMERLTSEAKDLRQLMERVTNPSWGKKAGGGDEKAVALKTGIRNPVAGKIVRGFGARDDFGVMSEGVTFGAQPSSPIVAPQNGRVVFAGPFKGYGKIVILQHPGNMHSFLAGFGHIDADMGQMVQTGEPLGALPAKGEGKPELYFEWRRGSDPIDPTSNGMAVRVRK